ncbi:MAG: SgcJ/EcaC family oxidoreductase [Acidobacteriota bacterium]
MTRTPIIKLLPVSIVGLLICYAVPGNAQSRISREDEEAIKKVIAGTTEAFNKHDAKAFVQFYTPDAELVTVRGERMKGAAEIEKGLSALFATRATAATLKPLDVSIRFIKPDVAVAQVTNEMSGVINAEGEKMPPHKELSIRVLVKQSRTWRITAFHNTIISSSQSPAR